MANCEYQNPVRCRKRARYAVVHLVAFGSQVGPNGDVPVYLAREAKRCRPHRDTALAHVIQVVTL